MEKITFTITMELPTYFKQLTTQFPPLTYQQLKHIEDFLDETKITTLPPKKHPLFICCVCYHQNHIRMQDYQDYQTYYHEAVKRENIPSNLFTSEQLAQIPPDTECVAIGGLCAAYSLFAYFAYPKYLYDQLEGFAPHNPLSP